MEIALSSLALLIAALCAGTMGFGLQPGATCTVAVDEVVSKRRFNRLTAMVEASIWVAGGLALAETFHCLGQTPSGYPLSYLTVLEGIYSSASARTSIELAYSERSRALVWASGPTSQHRSESTSAA
jgi:hypothetical protein